MIPVIKQIRKNDPKLVKNLFSLAGENCTSVNRAFFNDDKNILLVAYDNLTPCGFLYAYVLDQLDTNRPEIYLHSIDVFPKYRRQGIGSALIENLKIVARRRKCTEIFLITNTGNKAAMKLYQKTGGIRDSTDEADFIYKI